MLELLDAANTGIFGHPEPTAVRVTPVRGKAILVSGHDLKDLVAILEQTRDKGINVYTHGELLRLDRNRSPAPGCHPRESGDPAFGVALLGAGPLPRPPRRYPVYGVSMTNHAITITTRDGKQVQFTCDPAQVLLFAAEQAGFLLPSSCRSGACGGSALGLLLCRSYPRSDLRLLGLGHRFVSHRGRRIG